MELIPSIDLGQRSIGAETGDHEFQWNQERLIALSSWMMVLGTIRLVCTFADYVGALINASRFDRVSLAMLGKFVEENQPILALSVAWPLVIGLLLRRARWPELLPASAVTFLILSLGGVVELFAELNRALGDGVTVGSFHLTRRALSHPTLSDVALGLLGAGQLLIEFATAVRCVHVAWSPRRTRAGRIGPRRPDEARRARFGRLAVYASLGFLMLMVRLPVWATYLDLLNDSRFVREFMIKSDMVRINGPPRVYKMSPEEERVHHLHGLLRAGTAAMVSDRHLAAKDAYLQIIALAESSGGNVEGRGSIAVVAEARNNLAWLLATCSQTELREPKAAVEHARCAVTLEPKQANFWNTLGVALYRNGEWDQAKTALLRAIELRGEGESFDWFFLALIDLKQARKTQARDWYDKALKWYHDFRPTDHELYRFHVEAAEAFGLPKPARPPATVPGKRRP
jgi:tetratricopeptide (TPR) repeat protein